MDGGILPALQSIRHEAKRVFSRISLSAVCRQERSEKLAGTVARARWIEKENQAERRTRQVLLPPKPNELDTAMRTWHG